MKGKYLKKEMKNEYHERDIQVRNKELTSVESEII